MKRRKSVEAVCLGKGCEARQFSRARLKRATYVKRNASRLCSHRLYIL